MDRNESVVISSLCDEGNLEIAIKLIQSTYWANSRSNETVLASIKNSLPFFIFKDGLLVGVVRVISDYSTFAYLCDVVIEPRFKGVGFLKCL